MGNTFGPELSSTERSRKGFLLFGAGDVGGAFIGPAGGKADRTGVFGVLLLLPPDEFFTRNGLVSEIEDSDIGIFKSGAGSSNGDISSTKEFMSVNVQKTRCVVMKKGLVEWDRGGGRVYVTCIPQNGCNFGGHYETLICSKIDPVTKRNPWSFVERLDFFVCAVAGFPLSLIWYVRGWRMCNFTLYVIFSLGI